MIRSLTLVAMAFLLVFSSFGVARAFSCGTRLVRIGDTTQEVLHKCGVPTSTDSWEEERVERVWGSPYTVLPFGETRMPMAAIVHVTIEEWIYNLGPAHFMRFLRFENNRLVGVDTGDYGY